MARCQDLCRSWIKEKVLEVAVEPPRRHQVKRTPDAPKLVQRKKQ